MRRQSMPGEQAESSRGYPTAERVPKRQGEGGERPEGKKAGGRRMGRRARTASSSQDSSEGRQVASGTFMYTWTSRDYNATDYVTSDIKKAAN